MRTSGSKRRAATGILAAVAALLFTATAGYADPGAVSGGRPENRNTVHGEPSHGDLWPSCHGDDGALYTANGDGIGFAPPHAQDPVTEDIVFNRVSGSPYWTSTRSPIVGSAVSVGGNPADAGPGKTIGQIWTGGGEYNRKPTGLLCVDHTFYLAVQDLRKDFSVAPAATILKSTDHGKTWTWNQDKPMFGGFPFQHRFTTVFFLDYGRDSVNSPDPEHVYAYGLDESWAMRQDLYLARVPKSSIQDVTTWQWSTGPGTWSASGVMDRAAVIHDDAGHLSQGSVVYDKPLGRYIYTSWSETATDKNAGVLGGSTWEFYESPAPWGPWTRFATTDFGPKCGLDEKAIWTPDKHAGYATTTPSKFLSPDGRTMWVQSNVLFVHDPGNPRPGCPSPQGAPDHFGGYSFSLRPLWLTTPDNLLRDPGFEGQQQLLVAGQLLPVGPLGAPWATEGPDLKGTDIGAGLASSGAGNAWIHPFNRSTRAWNAITQDVGSADTPIHPHTRYTLRAQVQTSSSLTAGFFGVRGADGRTVLAETSFARQGTYTELTVGFDSGDNTALKVFAGYWAPGTDSWLRLDGVGLAPG
ncbi:DUF4185 domain-containing protein [Amycolatopsis sp. NPDC098790]|uniref:DUF4185 domain-containing protein n=1 Tax=Amycolatopsis sp. NPDC098790 TaxID=3363939 RepID=UPI003805AE09